MAEALHSTDITPTDFRPAISQLDQTVSEQQNLLQLQQSPSQSDNLIPVQAFPSSESFGMDKDTALGQTDALSLVVEQSEGNGVVSVTQGEVTQHEPEMQARCSTKFPADTVQVIDDIALEDEKKKGDGFEGSRKEKRQRRRKRKAAKIQFVFPNICEEFEKREKKGLVYSRENMLALRFVDVEGQKKKWVEVYNGLDPLVAKEYDDLARYDEGLVVDFDPRPQFLKAASLGEEHALDHAVSNEADFLVPGGEFSEDDDSDEDYSSLQKPAFMVKGEPDFDSGPPQDGLEFLRRVRWEAAQIPKVKVSKVVKVKEQRPYMPQIPDIVECPKNLLPRKEWEDSFLADFSELRLRFSEHECQSSTANIATDIPPISEQDSLGQMFETVISENFCGVKSIETIGGAESPRSEGNCSMTSDLPTLSTILKMEPAARNSMLKRQIKSIENMTTLPRDDCLWLFALCAVVDTPFDADTSASLRSLLRKCASLRADKTELDDEVIMLNILATISGRYFGQLEK